MPKVISSFQGEYRWLSNFIGGSEQEYASQKTLDPVERQAILTEPNPGKCKRIARKVTLRPDWDNVRLAVMKRALDNKFKPASEFAKKLIATGDALLIEGNTWHDNFWGNCTCPKCKNRFGRNWLGRLLMLKRAELLLAQSNT